MKTASRLVLAPLAMASVLACGGASAADRDGAFFHSASGQWMGPGEIIAGKFKGTKFICTFSGEPAERNAGLVMDGGCRVGMFTQKMRATVQRDGNGYSGKFQDGAEGKGLDIVSGNVDGRKLVLAIHRAQLKGAMLARLPDDDTMNVTVSVKVEEQMVPVIGVSLKRVDGAAVGAVSAE